jgi:hypothetical protein
VAGDFGSDVVVTAAQILHEGVTGGEDPRRAVAFQAAHRPQPGLQPPVICLDRIIGVLLHGMQGRGDQLVEHPRVNGRAVGGDLGRDGARAQRPGEEPPRRAQVAPRRQEDIDDLAVLVDGPLQVRPLAGHLDVGLIGEHRSPGAWRPGRAASMNSGVNRWTHR